MHNKRQRCLAWRTPQRAAFALCLLMLMSTIYLFSSKSGISLQEIFDIKKEQELEEKRFNDQNAVFRSPDGSSYLDQDKVLHEDGSSTETKFGNQNAVFRPPNRSSYFDQNKALHEDGSKMETKFGNQNTTFRPPNGSSYLDQGKALHEDGSKMETKPEVWRHYIYRLLYDKFGSQNATFPPPNESSYFDQDKASNEDGSKLETKFGNQNVTFRPPNGSSYFDQDKTLHEDGSKIQTKLTSPECSNGPKRNVMFLKTHKTGSSTVQNILVRKAYKEKSFVGLPLTPILFNYHSGRKFVSSFMKRTPPGKEVNMLVHHMVFNFKETSKVLPPHSVYVTILRNPATQFESVFHYMRPFMKAFSRVDKTQGVSGFAKEPKKYFKGREDGIFWWFGKNNMIYDLGFNNMNENQEYMTETALKMDKMFDLVMIAEHFDISLLLLKDLLCWDINDVVYLTINARNPSTVEHVGDDVREKIRAWNKADTELYMYYNESFWKKVANYGKQRLQNDLKELERMKEEISNVCVEDNLVSNKDIDEKSLFKMYNPPGIDITQYKLKMQSMQNDTCVGLILPEIEWYHRLNEQQYLASPKPNVAGRRPQAK